MNSIDPEDPPPWPNSIGRLVYLPSSKPFRSGRSRYDKTHTRSYMELGGVARLMKQKGPWSSCSGGGFSRFDPLWIASTPHATAGSLRRAYQERLNIPLSPIPYVPQTRVRTSLSLNLSWIDQCRAREDSKRPIRSRLGGGRPSLSTLHRRRWAVNGAAQTRSVHSLTGPSKPKGSTPRPVRMRTMFPSKGFGPRGSRLGVSVHPVPVPSAGVQFGGDPQVSSRAKLNEEQAGPHWVERRSRRVAGVGDSQTLHDMPYMPTLGWFEGSM